MNRELVINVTSSEITIALCEDKVLVELSKESAKQDSPWEISIWVRCER